MNFHDRIRSDLVKNLKIESKNQVEQLNNSMRLLAKWRSVLIQNTILKNEGKTVLAGPFQGMKFLESSSEGCHIAKLLGCYEQPLFKYLEEAFTANYEIVLNIGSAEGYYAIGTAMRMPNSRILAFDTNKLAQTACKELALANNVSNQIQIRGTFDPKQFDCFAEKKTLLLCDIEGAEMELLDPSQSSALSKMHIIVEAHECFIPGLAQTLTSRFSATHNVIQIDDNGSRDVVNAPSWFNNLSHLDQLLATWEWRSGPTPWLIMEPRSA